jgi:hypothetical protein
VPNLPPFLLLFVEVHIGRFVHRWHAKAFQEEDALQEKIFVLTIKKGRANTR